MRALTMRINLFWVVQERIGFGHDWEDRLTTFSRMKQHAIRSFYPITNGDYSYAMKDWSKRQKAGEVRCVRCRIEVIGSMLPTYWLSKHILETRISPRPSEIANEWS